LNVKWAELAIPKAGRVQFRLTRPLPAEHGMARVTLDPSGRWHVSFAAPQAAVERQEETNTVVGVDLGVVATVTTSDGDRLHCPGLRPTEQVRLRLLQRRMSRQRKGSNRRARTKRAIASLRAREADRRKDWVERTSTWLVRTYDVVVFEDLKVRSMMASASGTVEEPGVNVAQKRALNRSIAQQGWAMLSRRTEEKAAASGVAFVRVDPRHTSQTCSACGLIDPASRRSQAAFRCVGCGFEANADVNGALNIRARGLRVLAHGGSQWGVGEVRTLEGVA
jgi:IS605 OrfB family transposase